MFISKSAAGHSHHKDGRVTAKEGNPAAQGAERREGRLLRVGVWVAHWKGLDQRQEGRGGRGQAFSRWPTRGPPAAARPSEQARSPCVPTSTMGTSLVLRKLQSAE